MKDVLPDKALSDYVAAIRLKPDLAAAYFGRGMVAVHKNNYPGAEADFSKSVELDHEKDQYYKYLYSAYVLNPAADPSSRRYPNALEILSEGLRFNPTSIFLHSQRGLEYKGLKENDKAIEDFTRAVSLFKNNRPAENVYDFIVSVSQLANFLHEKQDDAKALAMLTDAIETVPTSPIGYFYRGLFYYNLKEKAKAYADWTIGSQTGTDDLWQKQNRNNIAIFAKIEADGDRNLAEALRTELERNKAEQRAAIEKIQKRTDTLKALGGAAGNIIGTIVNNRQNSQSSSASQTSSQTTQSGELSNGGTVSAQKNWGPWSTSSCNSSIQISVINDGPVPGDNTLTYWRIRARSLNGRRATIEVYYGESQAEISYAIANGNANARRESWYVSGPAYLESDTVKQNFPQVDIRNNSNIFMRVFSIGWMDSRGIVETVRCGAR